MSDLPMTAPTFAIVVRCPKCEGFLSDRPRRDGSGTFLGCDNYPDCRFTTSADLPRQLVAEKLLELEAELAATRKRLAEAEAELAILKGGRHGAS